MGLFDIFKNKKLVSNDGPQQRIEGASILYHEDDFCQVEILPKENLPALKRESSKINDFSEEHFDGAFHAHTYFPWDQNKTELRDRGIRASDIELSLEKLGFERIENVLTGQGNAFKELHMNCVAFGQGDSAIYYDFEGNIVQHIWLTNHWVMDYEKLGSCLQEIGMKWNLLLQDWNLAISIDLTHRQAIDDYLSVYK